MKINFEINGVAREIDAPPMKRLLDVLREELCLTGTKEGCGEGECGACSVIVDGEVINSWLAPICQSQGASVLAVERLSRDGRLDPVQQASLDCRAAQCGICAPGMLISARSLLDVNPRPAREETRAAIAGNLCPCTGYIKIIDAIE